MKVDAVLWDYDGTIVNSVPKNIEITKQILAVVTPHLTEDNLPKYLKNEELYHIANHQSKNWQDLYLNYYGMSEKEMLIAGSLWTEYQLKNQTPVALFSGIQQTISQIAIPQAICSQNSSENIIRLLKENNLAHKFNVIIGFDDIPSEKQKPSAYGGIKCLNQLFKSLENKNLIYIGDHEGDVEFARNLEKEAVGNIKVISLIVKYSGANTKLWNFKPDFEINTPSELIKIIGHT